MANLVMGAMSNLVPKLYQLLKEEYKLQTRVKERIRSLTKELEVAQTALCEVGNLPWDQVDKQVQLWTQEVREASYDMEDVLDTFLVRVHGPDSAEQKKSLFKGLKKVVKLLKTSKVRRKISSDVEDIMIHLQEVTERCRRYKVHDIVARPAKASPIDPRLHAMYNKVQDLVGMDESSGELISKLQPLQWDGASNLKMKIVSVAGVGGLGKTTLAKAVYDELNGDFNYGAFVPIGRNPDLKKVLKDILMDLDQDRRLQLSAAVLDERQLIDELRWFLKNKRYFIVVDDIWEIPSWEQIKLAIVDNNNCGARIVITTRNHEVAEKAEEVYKLRPLPDGSSRELFLTRIGDHEGKLVDNKPDEVTIKFLKKCAGIPLAIITMASLLAGKPRERWDELYTSIGFGCEDNDQAKNTMRIVSFSYYDLPAHLRTCLLYLSAFPEDSVIPKDSLVRMWIAEGFVEKKQAMRLFDTGEGYFHDLINRSMLEVVKSRNDDSIVIGCRVHDMVLDFIRSMSDQENFFSIVLDNGPDPLLKSNNVPRRLAHHNRNKVHGHHQGDDLKMAGVRSLFAISCGIEASDPFHGLMLLRVLVIDNCNANKGGLVFRNEHVRHLLHLRFLSIRGTRVDWFPEEIRRLRFLQVLDLKESVFAECLSLGSLPEQLVRLCLPSPATDDISSLTRLTSLEELSIPVKDPWTSRWCLPTELRVLELRIWGTKLTGFWKYVHHLNKLEHLTISGMYIRERKETDFVLPSSLRHMALRQRVTFRTLPSCFNNVSCLPNLSHLELSLAHLDEHDLKRLGRLPALRFLGLELDTSYKVSSVVVVGEKDAPVYFAELRCCVLWEAMASFYADEVDKSISFHVWNGRQARRRGTATAGATGGVPRHRFMPCLQVFRFVLGSSFREDDDRCCDNLGFEYGLPSLREIRVSVDNDKMKAAVRSAAEAHPNRPAVHTRRSIVHQAAAVAVGATSCRPRTLIQPCPGYKLAMGPLPQRRSRLLLPRPHHQHLW